MTTIRWPRRALASLEGHARHIAADSPDAARRVLADILAVVDRLADFPALGRPGARAGTRELVVPAQTAYIVV